MCGGDGRLMITQSLGGASLRHHADDASSLKAEGHARLRLLLCGLSPGGLDKSGKTDMTYKHFLTCSKIRLAVFYVWTTTGVRIFYVFPKTMIFPIVLWFLEKLTIGVKKTFEGDLLFLNFSKLT